MSTIIFVVIMATCFAGLAGIIGYILGVIAGIKLGKDYQRLKDKEEALENGYIKKGD